MELYAAIKIDTLMLTEMERSSIEKKEKCRKICIKVHFVRKRKKTENY